MNEEGVDETYLYVILRWHVFDVIERDGEMDLRCLDGMLLLQEIWQISLPEISDCWRLKWQRQNLRQV